ncbi:hypothetical protein R83H12_02987 [Fibrobacteria bacterium R8-3-H12]
MNNATWNFSPIFRNLDPPTQAPKNKFTIFKLKDADFQFLKTKNTFICVGAVVNIHSVCACNYFRL